MGVVLQMIMVTLMMIMGMVITGMETMMGMGVEAADHQGMVVGREQGEVIMGPQHHHPPLMFHMAHLMAHQAHLMDHQEVEVGVGVDHHHHQGV